MWEVLFVLALSAVVYAYFGFPLLLGIAGKILNREVRQRDLHFPVSLIIAAYNEEEVIEKRIKNALSLEYPEDKLEIIITSDGSTDRTNEIVRRYFPRVKLLDLPRQGKIHALHQAVESATGEILVFSDANIHFARDAVKMLVRNFADPAVGGVAGNKVYSDVSTLESTSKGEQLYWSYDRWLKKMETLTGSIISADGAIYAIRKEFYHPPRTAAVTDDFAISTEVVLRGYRLVFEPQAVAYEEVIGEAEREFSRKVRLMSRGLCGVQLRKSLLNPMRSGFYSITLFSHKLLRRFVGLLLLVMLTSSAMAAVESILFVTVLILQLFFYLAALTGFLFRSKALGRSKILLLPFFFCLGNLAATIAVWNLLRGTRIEQWEPQRHSRFSPNLPKGT